MNGSQNRLALLVALLLASSAVVFAVGTAIEHSQRANHHDEAVHSEGPGETTTTPASGETAVETTAPSETRSEKIAGIDPESWLLVGVAIAASILVAAGVYWRRGRWFVAAVVVGLCFAVADTRELVHQVQESRTTVAVIAAILIALHVLAALVAGIALRSTQDAGATARTA